MPLSIPLRRASVACAAALIALAPALPAGAQAGGVTRTEDAEIAYRRHMSNGVKLFQDRNYDAAIVEFQAAYAVQPNPNPWLNVALCHKERFDYPKAIATLERTLIAHGTALDAADRAAAENAIAEMKALLGYVVVEVVPPEATILVDGEPVAPAPGSTPIPLSPRTHRVGARADGYATAETTVTVTSGPTPQVVRLRLVADRGHVALRAPDPTTAIAVDGRFVAYGTWAGLVGPGDHLVQFTTRKERQTTSLRVRVVAGKTHDVAPDRGGEPTLAPPPLLPDDGSDPPRDPDEPAPAGPEPEGLYAIAGGSLLVPISQPEPFGAAPLDSGAAGSFRLGYRVNVPAAFEAMFEYGNVTVDAPGAGADGGDLTYSLNSLRLGLNLRLMTPGERFRVIGTIGGGAVYSRLDYDNLRRAVTGCRTTCAGIDPYLLGEVGAEIDFRRVLVGLSIESHFQSTKAVETDQIGTSFEPYDNHPLVFLGGGLRVGYALW